MNKIKINFPTRTKVKLSEIERIIRDDRIIIPCPSRQTLIGMCEDGTFESVGKDAKGIPQPTTLGWLVFEDSFLNWLQKLDNVKMAA